MKSNQINQPWIITSILKYREKYNNNFSYEKHTLKILRRLLLYKFMNITTVKMKHVQQNTN